MEGMILAAGAGTRLGAITDALPKALVQVGGKPLLGWVAEAMARAGVTRIIINTHHHEEQIRAYVRESGLAGSGFRFFPGARRPLRNRGRPLQGRSLCFGRDVPFSCITRTCFPRFPWRPWSPDTSRPGRQEPAV